MSAQLFEIAMESNGELVRGGIKATLQTVKKWIAQNQEGDPDTKYVAVPASEDAVTYREFMSELHQAAREASGKEDT